MAESNTTTPAPIAIFFQVLMISLSACGTGYQKSLALKCVSTRVHCGFREHVIRYGSPQAKVPHCGNHAAETETGLFHRPTGHYSLAGWGGKCAGDCPPA